MKPGPSSAPPSGRKVVTPPRPPARNVPVARPYIPPPAVSPRKSSGRSLKVAGVVLFGLFWLSVGAVVLPRFFRSPQSAGKVALAGNEGSAEPATVVPPPAPLPESRPAPKEELLLARPHDDGPRVVPRLPPGGGALEVAADIDRDIDRRLAEAGVPASPLADDAEFLRRVSLDLTGRIPTREQTVAFLGSSDPYKRSRVIDELLASPEYGRHFAAVWTDLLVKRDFENNRNLKTEDFANWLADRLNRGDGWDRIVTALVTASGDEGDNPAVFFLLANQDNNQPAPNKLTGATGNLFLGVQIQCAECHVHPFNDKWSPDDFWGLAAFFGHTRAQREGPAKKKVNNNPATIVEVDSTDQERPRARALLKGKGKNRAAPVPAGATIGVPDPTNPMKTLRTVPARFFEGPKSSLSRGPYRPALAAWLTSADNPYFARALVNRTWAQLLGRGFVNPVDDLKDDHPPSHPEVMERLAREFTRNGDDLKFLVRAICNTRAYQRTSRPLPGNAADDRLFSHVPVRVLGARELLASVATATGVEIKDTAPRKQPRKLDRGGDAGLARFFDTQEFEADPTEYSSGVPQVLRLMNSNLSGGGSAVVSRLAGKGRNRQQVIEDLYLTVLSRRPSEAEVKGMAAYVEKQKDPARGYTDVFWALLNSAEFACNR